MLKEDDYTKIINQIVYFLFRLLFEILRKLRWWWLIITDPTRLASCPHHIHLEKYDNMLRFDWH